MGMGMGHGHGIPLRPMTSCWITSGSGATPSCSSRTSAARMLQGLSRARHSLPHLSASWAGHGWLRVALRTLQLEYSWSRFRAAQSPRAGRGTGTSHGRCCGYEPRTPHYRYHCVSELTSGAPSWLKAPCWWCHSSPPQPPGASSPRTWLRWRCALTWDGATERRRPQWEAAVRP